MENVTNRVLPSLKEDISCDILIIGGGIAGLMTAYFLKDKGKNVVLIEANKCAEGASSKNTGKLTFMQGLIYQEIEKNYNSEIASLYLKSQKEAISLAKAIILDNSIDCNLKETESYIFNNNEDILSKFKKELEFYQKNNIDCKIVKTLPNKFPIKYALTSSSGYSFNPYKFLVKIKNILKDKIKIYEKTRCTKVKKEENYYVSLLSNGNKIKSKSVVVATQYPFFIVPYFTPFKTIVEKSFITSGKEKTMDFQAISSGKKTFSINYYHEDEGYLLYSRKSHYICKDLDVREDEKEITLEYEKYFNSKPLYYFQNHDLMTYDHIPYIGRIDNNMFVLTGFNKWGNTNGIIGGKIISDLILNLNNDYQEVFDPKRSLSFLKIKNLLVYNTLVMSRYILNKVKSNQTFYDNNVKIKDINGKKCGIYTDEKGDHIVSNICPHMKCNLVFNYVDKTWDCPCHASRFDIDGNVISGPSVYSIKIKDE